MSFLDTVLADTVGIGWRAVTGTVDPWTKQEIIDETNAATTHSLQTAQSFGYGISDAEIAATATANANIVTDTLKTTAGDSSDPTDAGVHIPGLGNVGSTDFLTHVDRIVNGAIILGILLLGFWAWQNYGGSLRREFSRK